jgi:multiple sugar transport system ATP-binding protein
MAEIVLRNVTKRYGSHAVLKRIDLTIAHGEFVVLVGPSGCGKSTLLRTLAGLEETSGGDILVDGKRVNDLPARQRNVAMVFQSYALFPHLRVDRNIGFGLEIRGEPQTEIARKVGEGASILNLSPYLRRFPRQLSGGQRQRVAMGRAIVRQPSMFLFDEPLSNLDAKLRVDMRAEIKALHVRLGNTIVYVTHDQIEAMTMADRIVVMRDGEIEQQGSPLELYDRPLTKFVAGFLGSPAMNFFEGVWRGGAVELSGAGRVPVPGIMVSEGTGVTLGIRPEHVALGGDVQGTVTLAEPTGADTFVHLDVGGTPVTALSRSRVTLRPGNRTGLTLISGAAHIFDLETGRRIGGSAESSP